MEGPPDGAQAERGVNYRALEALCARAAAGGGAPHHHLHHPHAPATGASTTSHSLSVSMLEIYNEGIYDLLAGVGAAGGGTTPTPAGSAAGDGGAGPPPGTKLTVREGPHGNYVPELVAVPVRSLEDVLRAMRSGYRNRTTFATAMNDRSSRSHCMLTVNITTTTTTAAGAGPPGSCYRGRLHLVDLAGSERLSRSGATGDRLKEAQAINRSLSALGDVIAARAAKRAHVPFRNSALTWLLADSLSGDAKTLMIVNVSPALASAEESACSLNFAARVNAVELGRAGRHAAASRPSGGGAAAPSDAAAAGGAGAADAADDGLEEGLTDDDDAVSAAGGGDGASSQGGAAERVLTSPPAAAAAAVAARGGAARGAPAALLATAAATAGAAPRATPPARRAAGGPPAGGRS